MNTYNSKLARSEVAGVIADLIKGKVGRDWFMDLRESKAKIDVMFVSGERDQHGNIKPSIKVDGAAQVCKTFITSAAHRALGLKDVVIHIDKNIWDSISVETQEAAICRELRRLKVKLGGGGTAIVDPTGRPVISKIAFPYTMGLFPDVLEYYGEHSIEAIALEDFKQKRSPQLELVFIPEEDQDQGEVVKDVASNLKVVTNYTEAQLKEAGQVMIKTGRGTMKAILGVCPKLSTSDHTAMMDELARLGVVASECEEGENFREVLVEEWPESMQGVG